MAELVIGIGSSHSPMVAFVGDDWTEWGKRDLQHPLLFTRDGRHVTYDEWLAEAGPRVVDRIDPDTCAEGARRVDEAVATLKAALEEAHVDVLIVIGDDQDEHLLSGNRPPFLIYHGESIHNDAAELREGRSLTEMAPGRHEPDRDELTMGERISIGYREPDGVTHYPVAADLAEHLIDKALEADFDVASSDQLPIEGIGMGHAYGFVARRLLPRDTQILPIMVNTYSPPSQPRVRRCRDFGTMLRRAIDEFPGEHRIGVVASGGLSHFIIMEDLDREVLDAFAKDDLDSLMTIPEATWQSGTSEIKNWITTAAVCRDKRFELIDYIPGYRTPAGTGTGLGFALWR